jgi:hypothetical protein
VRAVLKKTVRNFSTFYRSVNCTVSKDQRRVRIEIEFLKTTEFVLSVKKRAFLKIGEKSNVQTVEKMNFVRIIEHEPAWELHILLRLYEIPYTCDYCPVQFAMGRPLPLLVDGNTVYSVGECIDFLIGKSRDYTTIEAEDSLISGYLHSTLDVVYRDYCSKTESYKKSIHSKQIMGLGLVQSTLLDVKSWLLNTRLVISN